MKSDLTDMIAIVTGGRLKIGYYTSLKLLQCGATVIVTTRFPVDGALRYQKEPDYNQWSSRLHVYGLDMRHLPSLLEFIEHVKTVYKRVDILINNAAQTIRRPAAFYEHLMETEKLTAPDTVKRVGRDPYLSIDTNTNTTLVQSPLTAFSAALTQLKIPELDDDISDKSLFPKGEYDSDGQQVDLRPKNTWIQSIDEVSAFELLEVQLVNLIAPFILISQLKSTMLKRNSQGSPKFIVNVSSMEGQFSGVKSPKHPHTNVAKAGLNMLTRTCAHEFAQQHIYMNSVDTGWISKLGPTPRQAESRKTPLELVDGAARILDPIFVGLNGRPSYGIFYKNYESAPW